PARSRPDREYLSHVFPTFDWSAATEPPPRAPKLRRAADPHRPPKKMHPSFRPAPAYTTEDEAIPHPELRQDIAGPAWPHRAGKRTSSQIPRLYSNNLPP